MYSAYSSYVHLNPFPAQHSQHNLFGESGHSPEERQIVKCNFNYIPRPAQLICLCLSPGSVGHEKRAALASTVRAARDSQFRRAKCIIYQIRLCNTLNSSPAARKQSRVVYANALHYVNSGIYLWVNIIIEEVGGAHTMGNTECIIIT